MAESSTPKVRNNVVSFEEVIIERHVKNFMLAYRNKGKVAAGLVMKEFPEMYQPEIVRRVTTILNIKG